MTILEKNILPYIWECNETMVSSIYDVLFSQHIYVYLKNGICILKALEEH